MSFPKSKRIVDEDLLAVVRDLPCVACYPGMQEGPTHPHHVTSRGAGGGDIPTNLMPLCHRHHRAWHDGPSRMLARSPGAVRWLEFAERWDVLERFTGRVISPARAITSTS